MNVRPTALPDVLEITPRRHGDGRGWFSETWNQRAWTAATGLDVSWVQDNESFSALVGTVRGVHFQVDPTPQAKLVRVESGRILDVAVDLRRSSATYLMNVTFELSAERGNQLFIPEGFGHGFVTLEPNCLVAYKVSDFYDPATDRAISWRDPALNIDWGSSVDEATLSDKDASAPLLADLPHPPFG